MASSAVKSEKGADELVPFAVNAESFGTDEEEWSVDEGVTFLECTVLIGQLEREEDDMILDVPSFAHSLPSLIY